MRSEKRTRWRKSGWEEEQVMKGQARSEGRGSRKDEKVVEGEEGRKVTASSRRSRKGKCGRRSRKEGGCREKGGD